MVKGQRFTRGQTLKVIINSINRLSMIDGYFTRNQLLVNVSIVELTDHLSLDHLGVGS